MVVLFLTIFILLQLIRLKVYVRPSIADSGDVSFHVTNQYDSVDLLCYVDGIPFPDIEWYKGD